MKFLKIIAFCILFVFNIPIVLGQSDTTRELEMELVVTDKEKIILFTFFILAVVGIFIYLARDIIRRKKTSYDIEDLESKKDKSYEKYHSNWSDDYEELGSRNNSKEEKEFRNNFEGSQLSNYYTILQVPQDATNEDIKKQYRKRAKEIHPDKNKTEKSDELMAQLNKAYEILSNEESRNKYDIYLGKN